MRRDAFLPCLLEVLPAVEAFKLRHDLGLLHSLGVEALPPRFPALPTVFGVAHFLLNAVVVRRAIVLGGGSELSLHLALGHGLLTVLEVVPFFALTVLIFLAVGAVDASVVVGSEGRVYLGFPTVLLDAVLSVLVVVGIGFAELGSDGPDRVGRHLLPVVRLNFVFEGCQVVKLLVYSVIVPWLHL